jgi:structure-specific endonuclease subunit SLX1
MIKVGQSAIVLIKPHKNNYMQLVYSYFFMSEKPSFVYLLECSDGSTYVGATVDLEHRLRQHNKELAGGARATSFKVINGHTWTRVCYVSGFPNWQSALQFEWRWKQLSRKITMRMPPIEKRMKALDQLLALEKSTEKAIPYIQWDSPPEIHYL